MANLESNGIDESFNMSDIVQPPANEKASSQSDNDFLKGLLSDDDNEKPADASIPSSGLNFDDDNGSPQKPADTSIPSGDLNLDEDTGLGLPSSLLDLNEENSEQTEQPENQVQLDEDPVENNEQYEDFLQQENQEQLENIDQQEQVDQQEDSHQSEHLETQDQNESIPVDNQQDKLDDNNDLNNDNNDDQNHNSTDIENESDDGTEALTPIKENKQKTESPSNKKDKPKYNSKSFKDFIERNDICFKRHYDKSVQPLSSPRTIHYTNSCKEPPRVKGTPDKRPKRVDELFNESLKPGPSNSNYPIQLNDKKESQDKTQNGSPSPPASPRQTQSPFQQKEYMSEASTILANSKFDRIIDLTVGKKQNLTKAQVYGILRKFFIRNDECRSEILKSCGGDDDENNDEENKNENNDENKTYSAESLKSILKQAASSEGGSSLVRKIRPVVRAALFDMKQPIVSPMTQKQRAAMKFDDTLRTSMKKQPNSPTH